MKSYEQCAEAFEAIINDFGLTPGPDFSEADTRAKIIDRILHEALDWPETGELIKREEHIHEGFIDYLLRAGCHGYILEAKKVGHSFTLPLGIKFGVILSVKNLLQKHASLNAIYNQVTRYAHERGLQFCALSNGPQWLVFPGVRTDNIRIRQSRVAVFNGFSDIRDNFIEFYNLLSYSAVDGGSMLRSLLEPFNRIEPTFLFNSEGRLNIPYDRNPLSLILVDLLPKYFGDLHGDPSSTEMLKECFVSDSPVRQALEGYDVSGQDERPSSTLMAVSPVMHFYSLPQVAEKLDALLQSFFAGERAKYLQVMVGRVGIGKSTFLNHFFIVHKRALSAEHFVLILDFRNVTEATDLNQYFADAVWDLLSKHPKFAELTTEATLRKIFASDISLLERGPLSKLMFKNPDLVLREIASFLASQFKDRPRFLSKLATYLYSSRFARFVIVFDNVDQLDLSLQEKVIQYSHSIMSEFNAFVLMSMWEETYYSSKRSGRALSTIRTVPMQVARQSTAAVIVKRLQYFIKQINEGRESLILLDPKFCDRVTFCIFLDLILRSLLVRNRRVRVFLELVALGNIRAALEMFHAFLTAGSLDTNKIIAAMHDNDEYLVPVHEFVKSVMLGSKRFYSERTSQVLNLFAVGDIEHPSHFTRLRILQWLYERRHESTPFGNGFMSLPRVYDYCRSIGISNSDISSSLQRLVENALIENDLRAQRLLERVQAVRITPTGRYYLAEFYRMFPYIDLVMQDTPLLDHSIFKKLESLCESTDMNDRFERCSLFIQYLRDQEEEELITIEKLGSGITWRTRFVPRMQAAFEREKRFIIEKGYLKAEEKFSAGPKQWAALDGLHLPKT